MPASDTSIHYTRWNLTPLFWLSLAFLLGILIGSSIRLTISIWIILCAVLLASYTILLVIRRVRSTTSVHTPGRGLGSKIFPNLDWTRITIIFSWVRFPAHPLLLLAVISSGAARYERSQPLFTPSTIAFYNDTGTAYIVEGIVIKPPDYLDTQTNLVVQVERLRPTYKYQFIDVSGRLLAQVSTDQNWQYGSRIRLQGEIRTPPANEEFSYRDYLARQGIHSLMVSPEGVLIESGLGNPILKAIYTLREHAFDTIFALFPDPEASLLAGILLGMEGSIPAPVQEAFIKTGTSHIIAISGFNIAIISALLAIFFRRLLGRWRAVIATCAGISFYTILVGADAAVVRAAILGGFSLLAAQLGRRQVGLNSIAIIAAIMSFANPMILWDLNFQLSFSATLGMILYQEHLSEGFNNIARRWFSQTTLQRISAPVSEYILVTLAAQVLTIPVIAYHFGRISLISLLVNPIILPAQPPLMILGGIATILGLIYLPLGKVAAALTWPFALFTIRVVEFFAQIPKGEILLGNIKLPILLLFYAGLFTVTLAGKRVKEFLQQIKPIFPLSGLLIATILIWQVVFTQPDSRLHMILLNVNSQGRSGHAILIFTPTGRRVLINGGPFSSLLSDAIGRRFPWADHQLDWLVIANNSANDLTALPRTIERYNPDNVLWAGETHGNSVSRNLWEALTITQVPVSMAEGGQSLELGDGAHLKVLSVSRRGAVLILEWQNFRALLPLGMDLDYIDQTDYGLEIGELNVLLLADSGYLPANPPEWITNLNPQLILLSVAADDYNGLPSPETLQAIKEYTVLRTDHNGWIELTTDGEKMWVEVERK